MINFLSHELGCNTGDIFRDFNYHTSPKGECDKKSRKIYPILHPNSCDKKIIVWLMKLIFFLKNLSMFKSSQTLHSCSSETVRHIENGPRARECTLQPSLTKLFSYFNPYLSFGPKSGKIWWSWFFFSKICLCSKAHRLYTALACDHS